MTSGGDFRLVSCESRDGCFCKQNASGGGILVLYYSTSGWSSGACPARCARSGTFQTCLAARRDDHPAALLKRDCPHWRSRRHKYRAVRAPFEPKVLASEAPNRRKRSEAEARCPRCSIQHPVRSIRADDGKRRIVDSHLLLRRGWRPWRHRPGDPA